MLVRSRKATALRTKSQKPRKYLTRVWRTMPIVVSYPHFILGTEYCLCTLMHGPQKRAVNRRAFVPREDKKICVLARSSINRASIEAGKRLQEHLSWDLITVACQRNYRATWTRSPEWM